MTKPTLVLTPAIAAVSERGGSLDVLVRVQAPEQPAELASKPTPKRLALVVDRSGSMSGEPLDEALACVNYIASRMTPADQISVVVHPQSIVQSMVEFVDGSVVAQLSPPDMKLPIQYALTYPDRWSGVSPRMDWTQSSHLDFLVPDLDAFPALQLGFEVARRGGASGAVLNAANEVAVDRFLHGSLKFTDIPRACREILNAHNDDPSPTLSELLRQDAWAREEMRRWTR